MLKVGVRIGLGVTFRVDRVYEALDEEVREIVGDRGEEERTENA